MSDPVAKSPEKQGRLDRFNEGVERYKNIIWTFGLLFGWVLSGVTGYFVGMDSARKAAEDRIKVAEERIAIRVTSGQAVDKLLEDEQVAIRTYLESAQIQAADAFEIDCKKLKGSYTSNPKTCRYIIGGEPKTVGFTLLAPRDLRYPPLTP